MYLQRLIPAADMHAYTYFFNWIVTTNDEQLQAQVFYVTHASNEIVIIVTTKQLQTNFFYVSYIASEIIIKCASRLIKVF